MADSNGQVRYYEGPPEVEEVRQGAYAIAEFIAYLRFLAEQRPDTTAAQLSRFYTEYVDNGRYPTEITEDLGLPNLPRWDG